MLFLTKFVIFMSFIFLCGCQQENANIELAGVNYTDKNISEYFVDGYYGGNVYANSGGGSFFCCVLLPRHWRNNLKVKVVWNEESTDPKTRKQILVSVPKYEEGDIGFFAVHFYPNGDVKVLVTTKTIRYPGYPYPRPERK